MKKKFERKLREAAYETVPDRWDEIKKEAQTAMPEKAVTKKKYPVKSFVAAAACLCLIVASVFIANNSYFGKIPVSDADKQTTLSTVRNGVTSATQKAEDDFSPDPSTQPYSGNGKTVWSGVLPWGEGVFEESTEFGIGDHVHLACSFGETLKDCKSEETEFAVVVTVYDNDDYIKQFSALIEERERAKAEFEEIRRKCIEKYMASGDVSYSEAQAKAFSDSGYIKARKKSLEASEKVEISVLLAKYEKSKGAIKELESCGFKVFNGATAENEKYQPYLAAYDGLAIMTATKKQIESLENKSLSYNYKLYGAAENADEYEYTDFYSQFEIKLEENSKMTQALAEAFENADGGKLRVEAVIGYFGKEYTQEEIHELALAATGLTEDEYLYNGDKKAADTYREVQDSLIYHKDYNNEVVQRLLKSGELIELKHHSSSFIAELTLARAEELCENKEIAFIQLENENSDKTVYPIAEPE